MKIGDIVYHTTRYKTGVILSIDSLGYARVEVKGTSIRPNWDIELLIVKITNHVCAVVCKECLKNPRESVKL